MHLVPQKDNKRTSFSTYNINSVRAMIHFFKSPVAHIALPRQFTYPFHYTPHPLCVMAAAEVQAYLSAQEAWKDEWQQGKMFGVLVVQTERKEIGYLAAFSGILAGKNIHPFFVPPVYDLLQPHGFFKKEEEEISDINRRIQSMQENKEYLLLTQQLKTITERFGQELHEAKQAARMAREAREERRRSGTADEAELAAMIRESQFQKAELKRLERSQKEQIARLQTQVDALSRPIEDLKSERKRRSAALQQKLFEQFRLLNARGEAKDLCTLFAQTAQKTPPAGAGECAAPKLLQYAYLNHLKPIAMAEFWWGNSPKTEVRHHGYYYPACKGKCEPILKHMLVGLDVENNPLCEERHHETALETVYEDEWLMVVNKPAGMLSVPGKEKVNSVYEYIRQNYPQATGPLVVHRLDMATSGLLLIAKTKEVHQHLQAQFKNRTIKKCYIALLDGKTEQQEGIINLPLRPDPLDRPRQVVDPEHGKPAVTRYQVLEQTDAMTRIAFYPLTGRTHQLRVHAAHIDGLHCPIRGDELYGQKSERLYLHACRLEFTHPITGRQICIEKEADF